MYEFQDLTAISGHFTTNFKISGQRPRLVRFKTHIRINQSTFIIGGLVA